MWSPAAQVVRSAIAASRAAFAIWRFDRIDAARTPTVTTPPRDYLVWGDRYSFKTTAADSGGAHAVFEMTVNPGSGTPPRFGLAMLRRLAACSWLPVRVRRRC